jgi:hypothetical protein
MGVKISVDDAAFQKMVNMLALTSANALDYKASLFREAASVMVVVASMAKPAQKGKVQKEAFEAGIGSIETSFARLTINSGKRGGKKGLVWYKHDRYNGKYGTRIVGLAEGKGQTRRLTKSESSTRFLAEDWVTIQKLFKETIQTGKNRAKAAVQSIGLEQQSWLQIIQSLGIDPINHPPATRRRSPKSLTALTRGGKSIKMGTSRTIGDSKSLIIEMSNFSEIAYKAKKRKGDAGKSGIQKVEAAKRIRAAAMKNMLKAEIEAKNAKAQNLPYYSSIK